MSKIKTVIFDMDGLMFDTEKIYYRASQETADKLGMEYSFDVYSKFIGAGNDIMVNTMHEMYEDHDLLAQFLKDSQVELEDKLRNGPVDLHEGLIELLDYLKEAFSIYKERISLFSISAAAKSLAFSLNATTACGIPPTNRYSLNKCIAF